MRSVVNPFPEAALVYKEETCSTMEDARKCILSGCSHGTVISAGFQQAGRGRFGERSWEGQPDENLLFSLVLEKRRCAGDVSVLSLAAGLAVVETIARLYGIETGIKWPNDVLWQGRKVCGILCEVVKKHSIVGVGINCNQKNFSAELRGRAVSLAEMTGTKVIREEVLECFLSRIKGLLDCNDIPQRVNERLLFKGETLAVSVGVSGKERLLSGVCRGVGERGELILELPGTGERKQIYSGEI